MTPGPLGVSGERMQHNTNTQEARIGMNVDPAILARVRRADRLVGSYRGRDRVKASTLERDAQKGVTA